ncbi:hypothetical protein D3C74_471150 [compost metagenome]
MVPRPICTMIVPKTISQRFIFVGADVDVGADEADEIAAFIVISPLPMSVTC